MLFQQWGYASGRVSVQNLRVGASLYHLANAVDALVVGITRVVFVLVPQLGYQHRGQCEAHAEAQYLDEIVLSSPRNVL